VGFVDAEEQARIRDRNNQIEMAKRLASVLTPRAPQPAAGPQAAAVLGRIRAITSERGGIGPEAVRPDRTFAELGLDDLDVIELMMEVEEEFHIEIDNDSLTRAAGVPTTDNQSHDPARRMTPAALAQLVVECLQAASRPCGRPGPQGGRP
jgi:acyl carrier protein